MMLLQNKILRSALGGAFGGFLGWLLSEPVMFIRPRFARDLIQILLWDVIWAIPIGVALGMALGAAEGLSLRSLKLAARGALIGMVVGFFGGALGVTIAEIVFQQVACLCFIGRGIGWGIFGLFLGLAEGIRRWSLLGTRNAALGGAIGGFIGGVMFDLVGILALVLGTDVLSRFIALVILGACIGILIALVERALAQGAFRVLAGRQEGREILLDKPRLTIGHDERNDVYLSDRGVEMRHAQVRAERGGFAINALNGAVVVNGSPVTQHLLQSGDEVQLGDARLRYRTRGERMPLSRRLPRTGAPLASRPAPPSAPVSRGLSTERDCPRCAHTNRAGAKFCLRCGMKLT